MPAQYDGLQGLHDALWRQLQAALGDRSHGWRMPVLATVDEGGAPAARTVILRGVDIERWALRIYTDGRSPKVAHIEARPAAALVFWDAGSGWQLRVAGCATVARSGPAVDAAWEGIAGSAAARDYLAPQTPGSPLSGAGSEGAAADSHHLAIVTVAVENMDWLELSPAGHRRARFEGENGAWVIP